MSAPSARRAAATLFVAGLAVLVGCLGGSGAFGTEAPTAERPSDSAETTGEAATAQTYTPLPARSTPFPDGPKSPPERPAALTEESLREFLTTYERRWVYNAMYPGPNRSYEAHVSNCEVRWLDERDAAHVAVVACTAYAEYETRPGGEGNATGTPVRVHADWFTQSFTYLVDEDSVIRRRPTDAETERAAN
ncbi:hypothetical protein NDI76_14375 [Halogeometricum sp. S1BR25-6]|uniref:Lipoprotein n=1 Tax=Halogeometricum salsisoli TaxID=2950536 RepID=A0ABU2GGJ7_9EURY|nr:hypothetical protein [Halogeometricum sp. S1BR25-6]MDS0299932.1 hypothetical protein [Halogeometricum sp. S1BR25-6]